MTTIDPRTPVVVGVGQISQKVAPELADPPLSLLEGAVRAAADDAGASGRLLDVVDTVAVVEITSWPYPDPGAFLARRMGMEPRRTVVSTTGGNSPQLLVNELAADITRGTADVVVIGGAEAIHTRWRARREPRVQLDWESGDDGPCGHVVGDDRSGVSDYEAAHQVLAPTQVYPLFEAALRAAAGRGVDDHQLHVSELWSTFASVAATNPHAWTRTPFTADEIREVTPDNRMVCFPYPKRMCANIDVDQGAALLLCSYEAARAARVPDDLMVFLHAGADAHDHWFVTERESLAESPAIRAVTLGALGAAGIGVDDVARFDLYSCFPSAVQLGMGALGLAGPSGGDDRPLTVTGGLGFAGGPVNNYVTHGIARMVEACREDPESYGLTTALGWYATKHSAGVWSTRPPVAGFRRVPPAETQAAVDALPRREPAGCLDTSMTVEASSVLFERDGSPYLAIVAGLTPDGRRALATTTDRDVARSLTEVPWEGRSVTITTDGSTNTLAV